MRFFAAVFVMFLSFTSLTFTSCLDRSAAFNNMVFSDGLLFITDGWRDSLVILDVTDPRNPLFLAEHRLYSHPGRIAVSGEYVFVPTSDGSVYSVDISDPANPWKAASLGDLENSLKNPL